MGFDAFDFASNLNEGTMFDLFNKINARNTTLAFAVQNQFASIPSPGRVDISLRMLVPAQQKFRVQLNLLDTLKQAWFQYISFFLLIFWLIYKVILGYAFSNHILESTVVSELAEENGSKLKLKQA